MVTGQVRNAYRKSESEARIHPVKLIYMLYDRVVIHLEEAEEAVLKNDAKKRGENLGKAIAIVTELIASIKEDDKSEAAEFLRGLYTAILVELPKVSMSGDIEPLRLANRYLRKLRDVWKETAMKEAGLTSVSAGPVEASPKENRETVNNASGYGAVKKTSLRQSLSLAI